MKMLSLVRPLVGLSAFVVVVSCASSSRALPPARPAPVAAPPVENLPPVVQPPVPAPAPAVFSYAVGTYRYEIRNEATIASVSGDTRVDTVVTRAVLTYHLAQGSGDSLDVHGTVDTFTVSGGHGAPVSPLPQPIPFRFTATSFGAVGPSLVDSASVCGAPMSTLMVVAHDLLPVIPVALSHGAEWQDSTATATCRAMVPVTSHASRNARAEWVVVPPEIAGVAAQTGYRILRTTTGSLAGEGQAAGRQVFLTGTSSTTSALYVSPVIGMLLGGVGDATTHLIIDTGTQRQEFIQQVRQRVSLLH